MDVARFSPNRPGLSLSALFLALAGPTAAHALAAPSSDPLLMAFGGPSPTQTQVAPSPDPLLQSFAGPTVAPAVSAPATPLFQAFAWSSGERDYAVLSDRRRPGIIGPTLGPLAEDVGAEPVMLAFGGAPERREYPASLDGSLSDYELADTRGGFVTVSGITLDFGAVVRTYVSGVLALETQLTWTPTGPVVQQQNANLPGTQPLADGLDEALAGGLDLSGVGPGSDGLVLSDADGATAMIHTITNGQIRNLLVNAADDRDIRQEVSLTLTLPGFGAIQEGYAQQRISSEMSRDLDLGLIGALGR